MTIHVGACVKSCLDIFGDYSGDMTYKYPLPNAIDEIGQSIGITRQAGPESDEQYALRVLQEMYTAYPRGRSQHSFEWNGDREQPNEFHLNHGDNTAFVWRTVAGCWNFEIHTKGTCVLSGHIDSGLKAQQLCEAYLSA